MAASTANGASRIAERSGEPNQTVVVATHSPAILAARAIERRHLVLKDGYLSEDPSDWLALVEGAGASRADALKAYRGFLLVEGEHERVLTAWGFYLAYFLTWGP